jgi:hypothetical protein
LRQEALQVVGVLFLVGVNVPHHSAAHDIVVSEKPHDLAIGVDGNPFRDKVFPQSRQSAEFRTTSAVLHSKFNEREKKAYSSVCQTFSASPAKPVDLPTD